jgi:hypothetical protein
MAFSPMVYQENVKWDWVILRFGDEIKDLFYRTIDANASLKRYHYLPLSLPSYD